MSIDNLKWYKGKKENQNHEKNYNFIWGKCLSLHDTNTERFNNKVIRENIVLLLIKI